VACLLQAQVARDLTLLSEIALVTETPRHSSVDGFLSLLWAPDSRMNATMGGQKTGNVVGANLQVSKPAAFGEDWSMAAAVDLSRSPHASVNHQLQTSVNTISTYFDWRSEGSALTVAPAGSVVWVDGGGFFLSRPIFDSMALVSVPNVKGVRVYMNSQMVGRTNGSGNLLVPSLISYYGLQLKIASDDIPLEYTVDQDAIVAAPPRRGAAFVEFPARRAHYYRGHVRVVRDGASLVPAFGDLAVDPGAREIDSPIGVDGSFELEGLTAGTHEAEIRHKSTVCHFTFVAAEANAPLIDLGVLVCEVR
jgi:outer membrane usher protein FimD/PapC